MSLAEKAVEIFNADFSHNISQLKRGLYACPYCNRSNNIYLSKTLATLRCHHCQELFLVPQRFNDWLVIAPLGAGAMSSVYLAINLFDPEKLCAVKTIFRKDSPRLVKSFQNEIGITDCFPNNPYLARLYDSYQDEEILCMMIEYIKGQRLDHYLKSNNKGLPLSWSMQLTMDILCALETIHESGYLFLDLKPENVLIRQERAVLVDYGICMSHDEATRHKNDLVQGSPLYMAPDLLLFNNIDVRADIYSLGLLIYHLVSGHPYITSKDMRSLLRRKTHGLQVISGTKMKGFPDELQKALARMLIVHREMRFRDYEEVKEALMPIYHHVNKGREKSLHRHFGGLLKSMHR